MARRADGVQGVLFDWDGTLLDSYHADTQAYLEMFNTFNNDNNVVQDVNSQGISGAGLFNFDGFLRQGVGDPRQVQLSLKLRW